MSITRSYNKHTDTYYAYDTTYEWDEKAQKKVQRKKCIGKYDPSTGEIIPTGKRGRPLKQAVTQSTPVNKTEAATQLDDLLTRAMALSSRLDAIDSLMEKAATDLHELQSCTRGLIRLLQTED